MLKWRLKCWNDDYLLYDTRATENKADKLSGASLTEGNPNSQRYEAPNRKTVMCEPWNANLLQF